MERAGNMRTDVHTAATSQRWEVLQDRHPGNYSPCHPRCPSAWLTSHVSGTWLSHQCSNLQPTGTFLPTQSSPSSPTVVQVGLCQRGYLFFLSFHDAFPQNPFSMLRAILWGFQGSRILKLKSQKETLVPPPHLLLLVIVSLPWGSENTTTWQWMKHGENLVKI